VSTPALGLRLDGYHYENPPEKKSCLRWVRTICDPVPVSILKGLKVEVISDVTQCGARSVLVEKKRVGREGEN